MVGQARRRILDQIYTCQYSGGSMGKRRFAIAAALVVGVVALVATTVRLFIRPDLAPLPAHADAIIDLGGPGDDRDAVALALARGHRAPYLVQSTVAIDAGTDHCLPAVPGVTVLCFHPEPNTTRGEARAIAHLADQYHWRSVILVTTTDHAWRAALRVGRCFPGDVYVSPSHLPAADWAGAIQYQWAATAKAVLVERAC
jgi:uncharacterized SAM-binding protein YcdF (DUF218 family)